MTRRNAFLLGFLSPLFWLSKPEAAPAVPPWPLKKMTPTELMPANDVVESLYIKGNWWVRTYNGPFKNMDQMAASLYPKRNFKSL